MVWITIPPHTKWEEIYSESEVPFAQIKRLQPVSSTHVEDFKARLNDVAHSYTGILVSYSEFKWHKEQFRTLKSLIINL